MHYIITALGCKVNQYEAQAIETLLHAHGFTAAADGEPVDLIVVNTCAVTAEGGRKSRQMIRKLREEHPQALCAVCGCWSQLSPEDAASIGADVVHGSGSKQAFVDDILRAFREHAPVTCVDNPFQRFDFEPLPAGAAYGRTRAMLKIQDGCNQFCSYCIIPYVRGRIRSRRQEAILAEVSELAEAGIKEVVLTGIHISSYGKDKNNEGALIELIEAISKIKGIKRIRLGSLEPGIITEEFVERISSNSKVCPHFHLSLQSGCDSVLKRMNRKYTCKQYFEKCDMLRKAYKSPALTTDVIVGFPGETEEEFAETVRYLTELNLYEMHIFKYSPRKGTVAAAMKEQVAPEIKNERSDVLLKLAHDNKTAYEAQFEGCELEVLVEEVVKKDNKTYLRGHTERYMDILIDVGDISMPESFVNSFVYVTYTQNGGNLPLLL